MPVTAQPQRSSFAQALWVALMVALISLNTGVARAAVFSPQVATLDNGLEVVVIPNHRAPIVSHMVWYRVGAADEPPGKSGLAHFLEHLMFKGTATVPDGAFSKLVARNGGQENAFTAQDYTGYYQNVARDRLELVMRLEADRMSNLQFDPEQVETERQVILEERRQRTANNPGALLNERIMAAFHPNHPYGTPVIGWQHEIEALSIADLEAFYRRYYVPNNAILVVAGDVEMADVKPLAERYYGVIPARPLEPRRRPLDPPALAAQQISYADPRVSQPVWRRLYPAPSYLSGASQQGYALDVLSRILGEGATSRFYRRLVIDDGLALAAGTSYGGDSRDATDFTIYVVPKAGVDMAEVSAAVEAEIADFLSHAITEDELASAKQRLLAETIYARDSYQTGARVLGASLAAGATVEQVESWPEVISALTAEQVREAARRVLRQDHATTGWLLSAPPPPPATTPTEEDS